jgi:hypothetical protein
MRQRLVLGTFAATLALALFATPALAHGDHDARPIARDLAAGPYRISLWQVYPDAGDAMTPHLIVLFDGLAAAPAATVTVAVNAVPTPVHPSSTTPNGWETMQGLEAYDVVMVTIAERDQTWALDAVVVPPAPMSVLPMRELLSVSIAMTALAAAWVASRTARTWRRPSAEIIEGRNAA